MLEFVVFKFDIMFGIGLFVFIFLWSWVVRFVFILYKWVGCYVSVLLNDLD